MTLTSPTGTQVALHNRTGGTADDLAGTWPVELTVDGPGDLTDFLGEEAEALKQEIADLEVQLAGFKQEERHQLPELMSMNLSLFERTEQQIQDTVSAVVDVMTESGDSRTLDHVG